MPAPKSRWLIPTISSLATGAITAGLVLGIGLKDHNKQTPKAAPPPSSPTPVTLPAPPPGRILKVDRPCDLVPQWLTARLVPSAETYADPHGLSPHDEVVTCDWSINGDSSALSSQSRDLSIAFHLFPTPKEAADDLQGDRELAQKQAGTTNKSLPGRQVKYGPYTPLQGLGIDAFVQNYTTVEPKLATNDGSSKLEAAYLNLGIQIIYEGSNETAELNTTKGKVKTPLPAQTTQPASTDVAREIAKALNACQPCRRLRA